jgi:dTMP kinase
MLLSVEGLDGSGKTTVANAINGEYPDTVLTKEPTERTYGTILRKNLSQPDSHPLADLFLFMADRIEHINETIKPADRDGKLVISDRYADSTRAYQPVALTQDDGPMDSQWEAKLFIEKLMSPWKYEPDLVIYVDVSVDTAMERADCDEKFEKREFLEQVKENYDALADSDEYGNRIVRIDGEQSIKNVRRSALGKIDVVAPDRI